MGIFDPEEPERVNVSTTPLECVVCGYDLFFTRKAQMQTAALAFMNLDWASPSCTCQICARCGYIHWFVPQG